MTDPDIQTEKVAQSETFVKGAKRQRLPFTISWTCPMCGERKEKDLTDRYLSYPKWNEENATSLYCGPCGFELRVDVVPKVSLDIEVR